MPNPWLALDLGSDPAERIGQIAEAYEDFLQRQEAAPAPGGPGGENPGAAPTPGGLPTLGGLRPHANAPAHANAHAHANAAETARSVVRPVVAASWRRAAGARLDPDAAAPIELSDGELEDYRAVHPLHRVLPIFRDLLGGLADDGAHLMAVCDAYGRMLWVEGARSVRRGAESMNFVPGARWDEAHAGTNAPGTALALDHPVQIFATEHFQRGVQRWTCAAAPIHDPATGRLLGAIDVTGGDHLAHPHSLALVRATALAAEAWLRTQPPPATTVSLLGHDEALLNGKRLGRRHSELLCLLLAHPEGRTGEQMAFDLYPGDPHPVTIRAELSRLRRILGPELVDSRPYRLKKDIDADFRTVGALLDRSRVADALAAYTGPLLPCSDAPGVVRLREQLDSRLRNAVLTAGNPGLVKDWLHSPWGADDLQMWEAYAALLPQGSPARPLAVRRVARLAAEYGLATSVQRPRN